LPKVFRLTSKGKLTEGVFKGETINTPSLLAVEDAIFALEWAKSIGGLEGTKARCAANAGALGKIVAERDWLGHLALDEANRSMTSVCLKVDGADADFIKAFAGLLEKEGAAYDIAGYRDAPPGLRIWCGATVEADDIKAALPWIEWAYENAIENLERNSCTKIEALLGVEDLLEGKMADVFIANINRNILLAQAKHYENSTQSGAPLLLSGFYENDVPALLDAFSAFEWKETRVRDEWTMLFLVRR
jgi:hypothetical protein